MDIRNSIGGYSAADRDALAGMIYGEARNQSTAGKAAVGYTALTRASIAGVSVADAVYGSTSKKYGQYSFANPNDPNAKIVERAPEKDPEGWAEAQAVADGIMSGEIENPVPGATHYKTKAVKPAWAKSKYSIGKVDSHQFYALPEAEVAAVVSNAANSRYRRDPLVSTVDEGALPESDIDINDLDAGSYRGLPSVDGDPQMVSTGEFNFAGKNSLPGFGRMTPRTRQLASDIARTLPPGEDMTITATHGSHGLTNKTHTPGEAFDVRTRGLDQSQMDDLVTSTLYANPASIGINSGAGRFPQHMHVDMNGGYGIGLQSHSDFAGLSDYAKSELERYDEEMKSGEGYTPPVPESIAPVPEARPEQFGISDAIADAGAGIGADAAYEIGDGGAAEPTLSAGLSGEVGASIGNIPTQTADGVPIHSVKSISITPGSAMASPSTADMAADAVPTGSVGTGASVSSIGDISVPSIDASATGTAGAGVGGQAETISDMRAPVDASPAGVAGVGTGGSTAGSLSISGAPSSIPTDASMDAGVGISGSAAGSLDATPSVEVDQVYGNAGLSPKAAADVYMDVPQSIGVTPEASIGTTPAATAETSIDLGSASLAADVADQRAIDAAQTSIGDTTAQESIGDTMSEPEADIADQVPVSSYVEETIDLPSVGQKRNVARQQTQESQGSGMSSLPTARASDVWDGRAAMGTATDGSTVMRNANGSVSRYSPKYGHTEVISPSIQGWDGPSVEGFRTNDREDMGFWGGLGDSLKTVSGRKSVADVSLDTERERETEAAQSSIADTVEEVSSQVDREQKEAERQSQGGDSGGGIGSSGTSSIGGGLSGFFGGVVNGISSLFGGGADSRTQEDKARDDIESGRTTGLY